MKRPKLINRNIELLVLLVLSIILLILPKIFPRYLVILVSHILIYATIATSWAIFSGPTGYVSLAPAAFFWSGNLCRSRF